MWLMVIGHVLWLHVSHVICSCVIGRGLYDCIPHHVHVSLPGAMRHVMRSMQSCVSCVMCYGGHKAMWSCSITVQVFIGSTRQVMCSCVMVMCHVSCVTLLRVMVMCHQCQAHMHHVPYCIVKCRSCVMCPMCHVSCVMCHVSYHGHRSCAQCHVCIVFMSCDVISHVSWCHVSCVICHVS
jgi:hypothetical protein